MVYEDLECYCNYFYSLMKTFVASLLAASAFAASYNYKQNGADWGSVAATCDTGVEQSPIDLIREGAYVSTDSELAQLNGYGYMNYDKLKVTDNGHTVVSNLTPEAEYQINFFDGSMSVFSPLQFHFHAPSEHTINGENLALELHVVHYYKDTQTELGAVIGVMFDPVKGGDYENEFIKSLEIENATTSGYTTSGKVNFAQFLSTLDFTKYWQYRGSLTTPPCSEGIKWVVLDTVQPISSTQLSAFTSRWADNSNFSAGKGNNRVVMPIQERTLYYHTRDFATTLATGAAALALATLI